jgi:hypothetical protein
LVQLSHPLFHFTKQRMYSNLSFFKNNGHRSYQEQEQSIENDVNLELNNILIPAEVLHSIVDFIPSSKLLPLFLINSKWNTTLNQETHWQIRFMNSTSFTSELPLFDASDIGSSRFKTWKELYTSRAVYENVTYRQWDHDIAHQEFGSAMGHVLIMGQSQVGRTALCNTVSTHYFNDEPNDGDQDIAYPKYNMGESQFTVYYSNYPFSTHTIIDVVAILFDLSNPASLEHAIHIQPKPWWSECYKVLIGLKSDLKKDNTLSYKAFDTCVEKDWYYIEVSCKRDIEALALLEQMCVRMAIHHQKLDD